MTINLTYGIIRYIKKHIGGTEYETENERKRLLEIIRYAQERLAKLG